MNILIKFKDFDTAFLLSKEEGIVFFEGRTWSGMYLNLKLCKEFKDDMKFAEDNKYSVEYRGYCDEVFEVL